MKYIYILILVFFLKSCRNKDYDKTLLNETYMSLDCDVIFKDEIKVKSIFDLNKVKFNKDANEIICNNKIFINFYNYIKVNKYLDLKESYTYENKINKLYYFQFQDKEKVYDKKFILIKSFKSKKSVLIELLNEDFDSNNNIKYYFKDSLLFYKKNDYSIVLNFNKEIDEVILNENSAKQ